MDRQIESLINHLKVSKSIVISIADQPLLDHVAGALALAQMAEKYGLQVLLLGSSKVESMPLEGKNLITQNILGSQFTISWKYQEDNVEKVTTDINRDRGIFSITVHTKPNSPAIDQSLLEYSYSGFHADIYLSLGCDGQILINQPSLTKLLNPKIWYRLVTNEPLISNSQSTDLRVSQPSLSYLIYQIITGLNWQLTPQAATNIIAGVEHRTERFANPDLGAEFFACLMACLQAGGRRPGSRIVTTINTSRSPELSSPSSSQDKNLQNTIITSTEKQIASVDKAINPSRNIVSNVDQSPKNSNIQTSSQRPLPSWLKPSVPLVTKSTTQDVAKNYQR